MTGDTIRRTRLIAGREFRERVGQKAYRLALVVGMVLAVAAVVLPSLLSGSDDSGGGSGSSADIAVALEPTLLDGHLTVQDLRDAAKGMRGPKVTYHAGAGTPEAVRAAVRKGDRDLGILLGGSGAAPTATVISRQDGGGQIADQAAEVVDRAATIARLRSTGVDANGVLAPATVRAEVVSGSGPSNRSAAVVGVLGLLLYVGGLLLATAYANGVVSDRTNHVTERLLTAAKPFEHLTGKLIGVGAAGLQQFAVWMVAAVVAGLAGGNGTAFDGVPARLLIFFPIALVLTYVMYAALAAVLVLPVRKSEDVGPALAPQTILQILSFSFTTSIVAPGATVSSFVHTMSLIPFFSPLLMLGRLAGESVPAGELAIGILGPLAVTALLLWLVAPAYARYAIEAPGGKGLKAAIALLRR